MDEKTNQHRQGWLIFTVQEILSWYFLRTFKPATPVDVKKNICINRQLLWHFSVFPWRVVDFYLQQLILSDTPCPVDRFSVRPGTAQTDIFARITDKRGWIGHF